MYASEKDRISMHCILASLYFLLLPLTITTNSTSNSLLKLSTIPIGIYFLVSMVFYRKEFQINIIHLLLSLFTISTVVTLFVNHSSVSVNYAFGYFLNTALFLCISVIAYNEKELHFMETIQIFLLIALIVIPLFGETPVYARTSLVIFGQKCDPNYFAGYFIFPLTIALKRIFESKFRIPYIVLVVLSLYIILLTGSRGGLLAIIATIIGFAVIYPKSMHRKLIVLFSIVAVSVIFWAVIKPLLPEMILERFSVEAVIETRGTYRGDIWKSMFNEIKDSGWELIIGRGLDAKHTIMIKGKEVEVVAHNQFLQLLYNQGVIGLLLFVLLVAACIFRCIKKRKCVSIALMGMMVLSLSLTIGTSTKIFWNLIPYAAMAFTIDEKNDINTSDNICVDSKEENI